MPSEARRAPAQSAVAPLQARLESASLAVETLPVALDPTDAADALAQTAPPASRPPTPRPPETALHVPRPTALNQPPAHDADRSVPAPADPVYYSPRELDVFPRPVAPLRFGYPAPAAHAAIAGNVLVNLKVDEAGVVDQVAVVAAEPGNYFEEHTRTILLSARFSPGRRDGRAVKSQVMVRVDYDPAAREGTLR